MRALCRNRKRSSVKTTHNLNNVQRFAPKVAFSFFWHAILHCSTKTLEEIIKGLGGLGEYRDHIKIFVKACEVEMLSLFGPVTFCKRWANRIAKEFHLSETFSRHPSHWLWFMVLKLVCVPSSYFPSRLKWVVVRVVVRIRGNTQQLELTI